MPSASCVLRQRQQARKTAAVMRRRPRSEFGHRSMRLTGFSCGLEIVLGGDVLSEAKKIESFALECRPCVGAGFCRGLASRRQLSVPDHILEFYTRAMGKTLDIIPSADWLRANGLTSLLIAGSGAAFSVDWLVDQNTDCVAGCPRNREGSWKTILDRGAERATNSTMTSPEPSRKVKRTISVLSSGCRGGRLLADWARDSGISCPSDGRDKFFERSKPATLGRRELRNCLDEVDAFDGSPADRALTAWMMKKGHAISAWTGLSKVVFWKSCRLPDSPPASLGKRATDDPAKDILRGNPSRVATGGYVSQNRTSFARHWRYSLRRRYRPRPHRHSGVLRDQASGQEISGHQRQGAGPHRRRVSALMEALEIFHAENFAQAPVRASLRSMCGGDSAPVHPEALPHYRHQNLFRLGPFDRLDNG